MKILYISQAILPSDISNSLSIMKMSQAFHDEGHDISLVGIRPKKEKEDIFKYYGLPGGFRVYTYFMPSFLKKIRLTQLLYPLKVRRIILKENPDIVYSRLCLFPLFLVPKRIPVIYEMHSPGFLGKSLFARILFTRLIRKKIIRRIIVTTNLLKNYLQEMFPHLEITVARLSAEVPIEIAEKELSDFKKNNLQERQAFSVGYTGALDNYGLRGTEVICELAEKMRDVDFHVVGGSENMVDYWKKRIKSKNIFFYGHKPSNLIPYYLKCFDVALAPLQLQKASRAPFGKGMSPLKISQYLSYGCAIVASDLPAHRELLKNETTALLCDSKNIDSWEKSIRRLLGNSEIRERLKKNALNEYYREFTPQKRVEKVLRNLWQKK